MAPRQPAPVSRAAHDRMANCHPGARHGCGSSRRRRGIRACPWGAADIATRAVHADFLKFDPGPIRAGPDRDQLRAPRPATARCCSNALLHPPRLRGDDDGGDQALFRPGSARSRPDIRNTTTRRASRPPRGPLGQGSRQTRSAMAIAERQSGGGIRRRRGRSPHLRAGLRRPTSWRASATNRSRWPATCGSPS